MSTISLNGPRGGSIDTVTREVTLGGEVACKVVYRVSATPVPYSLAEHVEPGTTALLTVKVDGKTAYLQLTADGTEAWDTAMCEQRDAIEAERKTTPQARRETLADAWLDARDRLEREWSRESGDLAKGHAVVNAAEQALSEFDAAHPEIVAEIKAARERRIQREHGPAIARALRGED